MKVHTRFTRRSAGTFGFLGSTAFGAGQTGATALLAAQGVNVGVTSQGSTGFTASNTAALTQASTSAQIPAGGGSRAAQPGAIAPGSSSAPGKLFGLSTLQLMVIGVALGLAAIVIFSPQHSRK